MILRSSVLSLSQESFSPTFAPHVIQHPYFSTPPPPPPSSSSSASPSPSSSMAPSSFSSSSPLESLESLSSLSLPTLPVFSMALSPRCIVLFCGRLFCEMPSAKVYLDTWSICGLCRGEDPQLQASAPVLCIL